MQQLLTEPQMPWDPAVAEAGSMRRKAQELEVMGCLRCPIHFLAEWLGGSGQSSPMCCKHEPGQGRHSPENGPTAFGVFSHPALQSPMPESGLHSWEPGLYTRVSVA